MEVSDPSSRVKKFSLNFDFIESVLQLSGIIFLDILFPCYLKNLERCPTLKVYLWTLPYWLEDTKTALKTVVICHIIYEKLTTTPFDVLQGFFVDFQNWKVFNFPICGFVDILTTFWTFEIGNSLFIDFVFWLDGWTGIKLMVWNEKYI